MNVCKKCGKPCANRWCSQQCLANSRKTGRDVICVHCGNSFYLRLTDERKGGGKYCSVTCRRAYERAHTSEYYKIGRTPIHRIIAEQKIGRPLQKGETVHHIDGNKHNNHPDNLIVLKSQSEHIKKHMDNHPFITMSYEERKRNGQKSGEARRAKRNQKPSSDS